MLIEQQAGVLGDGALELVSEGRKIADKLDEELTAITLGDLSTEQAGLLARYGASRILTIDHPALSEQSAELYSQLLSDIIRRHSPDIVLAIHSTAGADLASRIAARLNTGLVSGCDRVEVSPEKFLVAVKPIYGGKAAATCSFSAARPQMATLNLDAIDLGTPDPNATAEVASLKVSLELEPPQTQTVDFIPGDPRSMDLSEAEVVVAGGRGLGSRANFKLVHELADVLGGSVGATRMAVDEEWIERERQIGLTGKTVRPKLFIACGISGAIQHTMGMKDSKVIVAINTDRNASIFKIADVGIVGDVLKVLPELIAQLREVMQQTTRPSLNQVVDAVSDSQR
mgnify:CR=1 FL=1